MSSHKKDDEKKTPKKKQKTPKKVTVEKLAVGAVGMMEALTLRSRSIPLLSRGASLTDDAGQPSSTATGGAASATGGGGSSSATATSATATSATATSATATSATATSTTATSASTSASATATSSQPAGELAARLGQSISELQASPTKARKRPANTDLGTPAAGDVETKRRPSAPGAGAAEGAVGGQDEGANKEQEKIEEDTESSEGSDDVFITIDVVCKGQSQNKKNPRDDDDNPPAPVNLAAQRRRRNTIWRNVHVE